MLPSRKRLYELLDLHQPDDRLSRYVDVAIIALIALNVLAVVLESIEMLHIRYGVLFSTFDAISVALFSVEYYLRSWACVEYPEGKYCHPVFGRLRYALTPAALIDLAAVLPYFLSYFVAMDLRFLRALRLLRIFKLSRYSRSMTVLLTVLREEAEAFGSAFFILVIVLIIASSGIYIFEHEAQPQAFGSIPSAIWWAVATLTTVGYGDVTPITVAGKIFGVFIMITGIGMVALPAGILASAFSEQLRRRRVSYEDFCGEVLDDGVITAAERRSLEALREQLGLSQAEAQAILARETREILTTHRQCPHCGAASARGEVAPARREHTEYA